MCNALRELMKPEMEEALDNKAKETAEEMAVTMIRHNEPDDKIALYTKLTAEQVADLRRKETVTA